MDDQAAAEIEAVREFRERLSLPGLVDIHTHFMPDRVLRKVWAYFDSVGPLTGMEWPITYRHEEDQRVALLRAFGVRAYTSMLYPHKPGMADWLNGWAAGFAARMPDCLQTATLFPEEGVETYVREAVESGARVFKSHLQVGVTTPTTNASTGSGGCSPTPPCRWSCTADRARSPASTPDPSRSGGCSRAIRG